MRPKAFSQALGLTASAFFGTTIRGFDGLFDHLIQILRHGPFKPPVSWTEDVTARLAAIAFYVLFFRSIHGIFSYDGWADQTGESSSHWEMKKFERIVAIITPPVAMLLGPFLIFHELANGKFVDFTLFDLVLVWMLSFVAYFFLGSASLVATGAQRGRY